MKAIDATRILLVRKKTTAKLRKQCMAARATVMRSDTPICEDEGEYYSSKRSEVTPDERLAKRLGRCTMAQLAKWVKRARARYKACIKLAGITKSDRVKQLLTLKATQHEDMCQACLEEVDRRRAA